MKKLLTLIIVALISFVATAQGPVVWDGTTAIDFGTQLPNAGENESNPILISTPQQLRYLASLVANSSVATADAWKGKCYKMTADFDLDNRAFSAGRIGAAAGNSNTYHTQAASRPFTGVFDGNGHTIANLNIQGTGSFLALFPYLSGGTVKNLGIISGKVSGANQISALVGVSNGVSRIINCYSRCTVEATGLNVGAIAACIHGNTTVDGCYNEGRVICTNTSVSYVGGLVGQAGHVGNTLAVDDATTIKNSYNKGVVSSINGNLGGLVGFAENLTISDCFNAADTLIVNQTQTGNVYIGGIIGRMQRNQTMERCFNIGLITTTADETRSTILGGITADAELKDLTNDVVMINDCYNAGPIIAPVGTLKTFAGIAGVTRTAILNNCINYGSIYAGGEYESYRSGGITANYSSDSYTGGPTIVNDSYYDINYVINFTDSVNGEAVTTQELVNKMPANFDNTVWTASGNLLPRLTKMKDNSASIVGATPIYFSENENYSNVSSPIQLETGNSVVWTSSNPDLLSISGSNATPNSTEPNKLVYLTVNLNNYKKIIPLTLDVSTGKKDVFDNENSQISIFPNPGTHINVVLKNNDNLEYNFTFYDLQGRVLDQIVKTGTSFTFDLSNYPTGTIILNIRNEHLNAYKRIIKI
ncbi:hypothetical protein SDC9_67181 [bioreactor metagenome]|uniref:Secretion system C-terminal sorting domain-containing protein n=1 Tax=bioreactor metagenome TaxID=1076179 RepID=A0A644XX40_9ZZZZ